jgi:hypothetical protein
MKYMFQQKKSPGSAQVIHALVTAELFFPTRQENKDTNNLVVALAVEAAQVMINEFHDTRKVTSHLISGGKFSWTNTSTEEHKAGLGKQATNDYAESPFAGLSQQFDAVRRLNPRHAAAHATAVFNGDFFRREVEKCKKNPQDSADGAFISLPEKLQQSLLQVVQENNKPIKKQYREALERQHSVKKEKQEALKKREIAKALRQHVEELHFFDLLHSDRCIKDAKTLDNRLANMSDTQKLQECKLQIKIWSLGVGKKEYHHAWSKNRIAYTWKDLANHLKENIYPSIKNHPIPNSEPQPKMPFRRPLPQLGTNAADVRDNIAKRMELEKEFIRDAKNEKDVKFCPMGHVSSLDQVDDLLGRTIGMKFKYQESDDGSSDNVWCYGMVVAVKRKNRVHVKWDPKWVEEGHSDITCETLDTALFNKDVVAAWHVLVVEDVDDDDDANIFSDVVGAL